MEVYFMDADTMEKIPVKNLKPGMLRICMMMGKRSEKVMYLNTDNNQLQEDGVMEHSVKESNSRDDTNQREKKGFERCVDLAHTTTFATVDSGEASSTLFKYSMVMLMGVLSMLFARN